MTTYTLTTTVDRPFAETLASTRAALADQGFGVLTEIDLRATLEQKLGVEVAPQVVLGACRPELAHAALVAEPSIVTILPCNVAVRADGEARTVVEALDPAALTRLAGDSPGLAPLADEARTRLAAALASLTEED